MKRKAPAPENEHVQEDHEISTEAIGKRKYEKGAARVLARLSMGITNYPAVARPRQAKRKYTEMGYIFRKKTRRVIRR